MLRSGGARRACTSCARGHPASAPARRRGVMGAPIAVALDRLDDLAKRWSATECGTPAVLRTLSKSDRPGGDPHRDRVVAVSGLSHARVQQVLGSRRRHVSGLRCLAGRRLSRRHRSPVRRRAQPPANDSPGADRRWDRRLRGVRSRVHRRKPIPAGGWSRRSARNARDNCDVAPGSVASAVPVGRSGRRAKRVAGGRLVDPRRRVSRPRRCPRLPIRCCRANAAGDTHAAAAAHGRADPAANAPGNAAADTQADAAPDADSRSNSLHLDCASTCRAACVRCAGRLERSRVHGDGHHPAGEGELPDRFAGQDGWPHVRMHGLCHGRAIAARSALTRGIGRG
jgi:hypothetical protein